MKLLTDEIRHRLPPLYANEHEPDPLVQVKFFTPWTGWTWYAIEFDGDDTLFGLVEGLDAELGYFSLSELESVRGPGGLRIQRDMYFQPTPLSNLTSVLPATEAPANAVNVPRPVPTEVADALRRILDRFMADEAADYMETSPLEDSEGHIYHALRTVARWLKHYTPA